jgi:hypothetical protein
MGRRSVTKVTFVLTTTGWLMVVIVWPRLRRVLVTVRVGVLLEVVIDMGFAVCGPCAGVGAS